MRRFAAILLGLTMLTSATSARAEDLRDALVDSYLGNPNLAAARASLRATDEQVPQALAGWRPTVTVEGGYEGVTGRQRSATTGEESDADRNTRSLGLALRQNIYSGGGTVASTSQAENNVRAARADLVSTEQQVLSNAIDAYTAVYRDRAVLNLALNNEQRLRRQLQATRDRFTVGEVARTDVAQAEARLARARADVETAKADLATSTSIFAQVVGREPGKLTKPGRTKQLPPSLTQAQAVATRNPEIISQTFALAAAQDRVNVAFADVLPSVDLTARANGSYEPQTSLDWQRTATLGINVVVPLYQGGADQSRVRQARETVQQQRNLLEAQFRSVQQLVSQSWDRLLAATAAIDAYRSEVRANDIALQGVQEENLAGTRTVLDVLDAEQELFTSQVNLVRAEREEVVASYGLKAAVGELTTEVLDLPVNRYNPTTHYDAVRDRLFGLDVVDVPPPRRK